MSDPIAEAAAQMSDAAPSSSEPVAPQEAGTATPGESAPSAEPVNTATGDQTVSPNQMNPGETIGSSGELPNDAATPPAGAATPASTGNVLVNAAPLVDAPAVDAPAVEPEAAELPRESHLMLLEAKIAAFRAKLANAERVALDEFEAIVGHIKAVLQ